VNESPIAVFDSGVGGLTVFREVQRLLPNEHLLYFGDTARLPYGNKSSETIVRYALKSAHFLCNEGIKLLVVACHTASACALPALQGALSIPVLGVIQPGVDLLLSTTQTRRVAVLGTKSTIESGIYQALLSSKVELFPIACPLFVPIVEEQFFDHEIALLTAEHYLHSLRSTEIDAALLACTHYPLLRHTIQKVLGSQIAIVESAAACAQQVQKLLWTKQLFNQQGPAFSRFYTTDRLSHLTSIATTFLGKDVQTICVNLD
jgi:glutamate racemase